MKLKLISALAAVLLSTTAIYAQDSTLSVAAFEGGYGGAMYGEVVKAFNEIDPNIKVELTVSKNIGEELVPQVAAGNFPDVVFLAQGSKSGFTENFVRGKTLEDLTDVLSIQVPGEQVKVSDKLVDGLVGNLATNPYGDAKVYLMPTFSTPTALVYDEGLLAKKGWAVPADFDQFFALGDKAKADGISLFTYPTAGYLDTYFPALLASIGGLDFYRDVVTYKKDVWLTPEARQALELSVKLATYAAPTTVGYANAQDFSKNQQSILDGTTLFMPNGGWVTNEMKDAPRSEGFKWGFAPVPAAKANGVRYVNTFVDSVWVPSGAKNKDAAKKFIAFLYSDKAAAIFARSNAIQPIKGLSATLTGDAATFYSPFADPKVQAVVGGFAATKPVPGVDIRNTLFETYNNVVAGTITIDDWQASLNQASNRLSDQRAN